MFFVFMPELVRDGDCVVNTKKSLMLFVVLCGVFGSRLAFSEIVVRKVAEKRCFDQLGQAFGTFANTVLAGGYLLEAANSSAVKLSTGLNKAENIGTFQCWLDGYGTHQSNFGHAYKNHLDRLARAKVAELSSKEAVSEELAGYKNGKWVGLTKGLVRGEIYEMVPRVPKIAWESKTPGVSRRAHYAPNTVVPVEVHEID